MSGCLWNRREWLTRHTLLGVTLLPHPWSVSRLRSVDTGTRRRRSSVPAAVQARVRAHAACLDPRPLEALVRRAVEAAQMAGAQYADAQFTRTVSHTYNASGNVRSSKASQYDITVAGGGFDGDEEALGVGVRVLIDGYWGFAASPYWTPEDVVRLAQDAVGQARANAKGPRRSTELSVAPVVTGHWTTPIKIDPFAIPVEEKLDFFTYWKACAARAGVLYQFGGIGSFFIFRRQEQVVATSAGSLFSQTLYQSGGEFGDCQFNGMMIRGGGLPVFVNDVSIVGAGWERLLEAKIPDQFPVRAAEARERASHGSKPSTVGRYTLVCDGATMAAIVDKTVGVMTQLDRALGYEANAGGTSAITDPLAMVGQFRVAAPLVTVTANRSVPGQLATVQWDNEGVVPSESTLVKAGVLHDFQTTRDQVAWLAPYYQRQGRPLTSNGCASSEDALAITMQQMPNLALAPSASTIALQDLVADVTDGILIEGGTTQQVDFQARNGLLVGGQKREIKNGRLGRVVVGGAVQFNSLDMWKHLVAVGGVGTQQDLGVSQYNGYWGKERPDEKGEPSQTTSHTVRAVAATITNQAIIDPSRKA